MNDYDSNDQKIIRTSGEGRQLHNHKKKKKESC